MRPTISVVLISLLLVALAGCGETEAGATAGAARWTPLAPPREAPRDPAGAAIVGVGDDLFLATSTSTGRGRDVREHVRVWRRTGGRWQRELTAGRRLVRDPNQSLVFAVEKRTVCVPLQRGATLRLACVDPRRRTARLAVGPPRRLPARGSVAHAAVIGGKTYVTVVLGAVPSASGRPQVVTPHLQVLVATRTGWRSAGRPDTIGEQSSDAVTTAGGLVDDHGTPCVAAAEGRADQGAGSPLGRASLFCLRNGRWARSAGGSLRQRPDASSFHPAGAATANGRIAVAITTDRIDTAKREMNGRWIVARHSPSGWAETPLTMVSREFLIQGRLAGFDDGLWALVFEQRPAGRGQFSISARISVHRLSPDGRTVEEVGRPLLPEQEIYGPQRLGLARTGRTTVAMYSGPNRQRTGNDLRLATTPTG